MRFDPYLGLATRMARVCARATVGSQPWRGGNLLLCPLHFRSEPHFNSNFLFLFFDFFILLVYFVRTISYELFVRTISPFDPECILAFWLDEMHMNIFTKKETKKKQRKDCPTC